MLWIAVLIVGVACWRWYQGRVRLAEHQRWLRQIEHREWARGIDQSAIQEWPIRK